MTESLKESASMQALTTPAAMFPTSASVGSTGTPLSSEERLQYEQEKIKLYEQMDEKVCLVQKDKQNIGWKAVFIILQMMMIVLFCSEFYSKISPFVSKIDKNERIHSISKY